MWLSVTDYRDKHRNDRFIRRISATFWQLITDRCNTTVIRSKSSRICKCRVLLYQSTDSQCVCAVIWNFTDFQQRIFDNSNFFSVFAFFTEKRLLIVHKTNFDCMIFLIVPWSTSFIDVRNWWNYKCRHWSLRNQDRVAEINFLYSEQRWIFISDRSFQQLLQCKHWFAHGVK